MILFAKVSNGYKREFQNLSNIWYWAFLHKFLPTTEANSGSCQIFKIELFAALGFLFAHLPPALFFRWHLVMFCVIITDMTGHFDFLHAPGWPAFLWVFQKNWQNLFERLRETDLLPSSLLMPYNIRVYWRTKLIIQANGGHLTWPSSGQFCCQNPCSGCNSGINVVVVLEYTFFQLSSNAEQIS